MSGCLSAERHPAVLGAACRRDHRPRNAHEIWPQGQRSHVRWRRPWGSRNGVAWDDLVESGGYAGARDKGLLRTEGRDYVVADGDVITIKV